MSIPNKKIKARLRLHVEPGKVAMPAIAPRLTAHKKIKGIEVVKEINNQTKDIISPDRIPITITLYTNDTFSIKIYGRTATSLLKEAAQLKAGGKMPGREIVAEINKADLEIIAQKKLADLNAYDVNQAMKILAGSARSMGIKIV